MVAHHLSSIVTKMVILVACDNTYTMESKDELVFVDFFIHPIPLSFVTNITCDLSRVIKGILVTNVVYD
jgi:hypothetical protein